MPCSREQVLDRMRRFCMALPEVTETVTFGHPTFKAGKKTFAVLDKYKGEYAIAFKAGIMDQVLLTEDTRFYVTPYVGKHGWTSLRLDSEFHWHELEPWLLAAYRSVALKRMLLELDSGEKSFQEP